MQLAFAQRAARVAAQANQPFGGSSPPPGYHPAGAGPSRQATPLRSVRTSELFLGSPTPPSLLKALWTPKALQQQSHSTSRLLLIQELGEACTQPGHNRLQELAADFSPTTRAPETRSLTDQLMDGYARGSGYAIHTAAAQELHDNFLLPPMGGMYNSALQAVLHPCSGTEAEASSVLLCQLQAMEVREARIKQTQMSVL